MSKMARQCGPLLVTLKPHVKIIAGEYILYPPLSRQYPLINDRPTQLQFLNFRDGSGLDKVHMSARYETYSYKGVLNAG